jgi:hypothetical protein
MGVVSPRIRRSAKHQGKNYQTIRRIGEAEFIAYSKVNPGKLNVASGGNAVGANVSMRLDPSRGRRERRQLSQNAETVNLFNSSFLPLDDGSFRAHGLSRGPSSRVCFDSLIGVYR